MMEKFDFLLGDWDMDYRIPKSSFHEGGTGTGFGTFERVLGGKYVRFQYRCTVNGQEGEAKGMFVHDPKTGIYRYWWFESSGAFMEAACNFDEKGTLHMNWNNSLLTQTFTRKDDRTVSLKMGQPAPSGDYELLMEVILTKITN